MLSMLNMLRSLLMVAQAGLGLLAGYLGLLTVAALFAPRKTRAASQPPRTRFLILIPAHNEEVLLPGLLASLAQMDYPADLRAVHVVADNCTDGTAEAARQGGAVVHERFDEHSRGKGFALQWLLERLQAARVPYDAAVILDADTTVSANFLQVMDARVQRGERVIQAYYAVRDPGRSWSVGLRYAALAVLHYLRPQGRMTLGGSAGLKGNGMVFVEEVLRGHEWSASLTEDIEFHMALLLAGERVTFAPDAAVWAEMPSSLRGSYTQNVRWERGRLQVARQYVPQLLRRAAATRQLKYLDAAMEHLIPPFSVLAAASMAVLAGSVAADVAVSWAAPRGHGRRAQRALTPAGTLIVLAQFVYLLAGLVLARAPVRVYLSLLGAPVFVAWKVWLYVRVAMGYDDRGWVRTERNQ